MLNLFAAFVLVILVGCGGGTTAIGPAPIRNTILSELGTSIIDGEDTIDLNKLWDNFTINGFKSIGVLTGYSTDTYLDFNLTSEIFNINIEKTETTLLIIHNKHGANNGDQVEITGLTSRIHGFDPQKINNKFIIRKNNDDSYFITIPSLPNGNKFENLKADLSYKYLDCKGIQNITQSSPDDTIENIFFNSIPAIRITTTVNTSIVGCSPNSSEFITYKYFSKKLSNISSGYTYRFIGQNIVNGSYSIIDGEFQFPTGLLKSGESGKIGELITYSDSTRSAKEGKTIITYEILKHTNSSLFVAINYKTVGDSGIAISNITDYFGKSPSASGDSYGLLRTIVQYFNKQKNEVRIDYSPFYVDLTPSIYSGKGTLHGTPRGTQNWEFIPIDLQNNSAATELTIIIKLGSGKSYGSYDLFSTNTPWTQGGAFTGSLVNAYDVSPNTVTKLKYKLPPNGPKLYYIGIEGNWGSSVTDFNSYTYDVWIN